MTDFRDLWTDDAKLALDDATVHRGTIVSGTGHRPERLGLDYSRQSHQFLVEFVAEHLAEQKPDLVVSGMALGFDMALADAAGSLGIPFWAAVPFVGQESRWSRDDRQLYLSLLEKSERVITVCGGLYSARKLMSRNIFLMDVAHRVLALYDLNPAGGTHQAIQYAKTRLIPIANLFGRWAPPLW